jgi:lipoate-protein ligase A
MTTETELRQCFSQRKVRGGKLVRLRLIHDGEEIRSVRITGDFMVHPEEALEGMEMSLNGLPVEADMEIYLSRLDNEIEHHGAELIGFSSHDIAELVREAMG